jgi:hypothetical protein
VRRDGSEEQSMKPMQWTGLAVAVGGAVLTGYSGQLSHTWAERTAGLFTGEPTQVDWYLLIGIMVTVGGGLLAQLTMEDQHG